MWAYGRLTNSHVLTAFTSSLYLVGLAASLAAGRATRAVRRQAVMLGGGELFFAGAAVNAAAVNIAMLIVGRMLLGRHRLQYKPGCAGVPCGDGAGQVEGRLHDGVPALPRHRFHPHGGPVRSQAAVLGWWDYNDHLPGRGCVDHGVADRSGTRDGESTLARGYSIEVLALTCVFLAAFGWSWGPLTWVIPGDIFPVEIRSAGQGISVAVYLGATFVLTQTFLAVLCSFKYATFIYYAAWVAVMTAFVVAFLPETKGVPLEAMGAVWAWHWYWGRFVQLPAKNAEALLS